MAGPHPFMTGPGADLGEDYRSGGGRVVRRRRLGIPRQRLTYSTSMLGNVSFQRIRSMTMMR